jgi:pimeloyl-ACP methyl ester carboxylesterase
MICIEFALTASLSAGVYAQDNSTPCPSTVAASELTENSSFRDAVRVTQNEVVSLESSTAEPRPESSNAESVRAFMKNNASGTVIDLAVITLPLRRHIGMTVPDVPPGLYSAWYEDGTSKSKAVELQVVSQLQAASVVRGGKGETVILKIQTPASQTVCVKIEANIPDKDPAFAKLSVDQPSLVQTSNGVAEFRVDIKECRRTLFKVTALGYKNRTVAVDCEYSQPVGPVPIVFVPGTAGSELDVFSVKDKTGERFWIAENAFFKGRNLFPKGTLNEDGSNRTDHEFRVRDVLNEVRLELSGKLISALGSLSSAALRVHCKTDRNPIPCGEEGSNCKCKALFLPIYKSFLSWGELNLSPAHSHSVQLGTEGGSRGTFLKAPYDWRKGIEPTNEDLIDARVEEALSNAPGHDNVILVAHSLGGLVSRNYIAHAGQGKVVTLIAVGTPWLGTPKTARALLWGYNFDIGFAGKLKGLNRVTDPGTKKQITVEQRVTISFLPLDDVRKTARTWPGVFYQLPTPDFMKLYGKASGLRDESKSIVWDWSVRDTLEFYSGAKRVVRLSDNDSASGNSLLFARSDRWRDEHLFRGNNYDVNHYLIAGYKAPNDSLISFTDIMDMQMTKPTDLVQPNFRASVIDILVKPVTFVIGKIARVVAGVQLHKDTYLTTDRGPVWGDGTSPLLSATAGGQLKGEETLRANPVQCGIPLVKQFLGLNACIGVIKLGRDYAHGSMLDDPKVRWQLWRIIRKENKEKKTAFDPPVRCIRLELTRKVHSTPSQFTVRLAGLGLGEVDETERQHCSRKSQRQAKSDKAQKYSSIIEFSPLAFSPDSDERVQLFLNQLEDKAIQFSIKGKQVKAPKGRIEITHVRLLVNEMEILDKDVKIDLNKENPESENIQLNEFDLNAQ